MGSARTHSRRGLHCWELGSEWSRLCVACRFGTAYSNEKSSSSTTLLANVAINGPSRLDPSTDRAVRPRVHDIRVRAVDLPKFQLSRPSYSAQTCTSH
ncbi:hypothetical protein FIBSPDRAFT_231526 [Athelia psychrophila]|uniref:Uncharacterized protein n=1 Tax=Athelia psychrophila TaxID=1759441 RepID=A0A165YM17_9AGAM|nr:hypothetical protein FIBSPDRAFT_231526 [Fibularhizoctonia sp. CBS 109695]